MFTKLNLRYRQNLKLIKSSRKLGIHEFFDRFLNVPTSDSGMCDREEGGFWVSWCNTRNFYLRVKFKISTFVQRFRAKLGVN